MGAVGPGTGLKMPVSEGTKTEDSSDTKEENESSVSDMLSDVGMSVASVGVGMTVSEALKAVVMPTTIPVVGKEEGPSSVLAEVALVGSTMIGGIPPEDPVGATTSEAGIETGSEAGDSVSCAVLAASTVVGMMKGPSMVETTVTEGEAELGSSDAVLGKIVDSGMPPEEPTEEASVGCTITLGSPPVEPTSVSGGVGFASGSSAVAMVGVAAGREGSSSDEPAASDVVGSGVGVPDVGETMTLGNPPVEPTSSAEVGFSGVRLASEEVSCSWLEEIGETLMDVSSSWGGAELAGAVVEDTSSSVLETLVELGWMMTSGTPPVDPTDELTGSSGGGAGLSKVGCGAGALNTGVEEESDVGSGTGAGGVEEDSDVGSGTSTGGVSSKVDESG